MSLDAFWIVYLWSLNMKIDRVHVEKEFAAYTSLYNSSNDKIRLKIEHTYRVAEAADSIAESLGLSKEDTDLAWLLGMLHDIGRFEQVKNYGTFIDSISVDHGALGADILFREGRIRDYLESAEEDAIIEKAIRLHNTFELPDDLDEREELFAKLIRDADKVDIMKVCCEFSVKDAYEVTEDEFYMSPVSDRVIEDALNCRNVLRAYESEPVDKLISHIALVFGLEFPKSFALVDDAGYLWKMLDTKSRNPDTLGKLKKLKTVVKKYVKEHRCGTVEIGRMSA